ncbi:creatininase family protein [Piscinibacter sp.]|uniref:creatininase family protein n=1 Tax=Piscinibacter sp. TaxID=1903157 RepID=UPI00355A41D6
MDHRIARILVTLAVACCVQSASAQANASVFLEELTWTELRDQVRAGTTTIIVPIGGTEQNGPAMVLGKHNVRVKALAAKVAIGLGHALVAPVIAYVPEGSVNPPSAHMRFAGTITIPDAAFEATLEYAARSFRQHGFRDIVFLGDHGGYQKNLRRVADKLDREWARDTARVHAVDEYYRAVDVDYVQALKRLGYSDAEIGSHAGLADTSLAMAVDPRLVRADRLHALTAAGAQGVYGEPARSTAQAGQQGVDLVVAHTIEAIKQRIARH